MSLPRGRQSRSSTLHPGATSVRGNARLSIRVSHLVRLVWSTGSHLSPTHLRKEVEPTERRAQGWAHEPSQPVLVYSKSA
jgi:hypothetical protein